jgi:hypothetical protein
MEILVLDTIHGGRDLAWHLEQGGQHVDAVDVYRGTGGISARVAAQKRYDLVVAPVHLDPDHPLLAAGARVITHHAAVKMLLEGRVPHPMVEVTGAQGKTTAAHALASVMPAPGVLHTSSGTWLLPEYIMLWQRSITPASVLDAAITARLQGRWLIAEESLGVSGAGDLAILTSAKDYRFAAGKKSALPEKLALAHTAPRLLVPPHVTADHPSVFSVDAAVQVDGETCRYDWKGIRGSFENPLLATEAYHLPLSLATAAACELGFDPGGLRDFVALPGRLSVATVGDVTIVDDANSGTSLSTTLEAAAYARRIAGDSPLTLIIGEEKGTVCEGFPDTEVQEAIRRIGPERVILVGKDGVHPRVPRISDAIALAKESTHQGSILIAVKTWR